MTKTLEKGYHYAVYEKHVAFWGNVFSNYHPCKFVYKGLTWNCAEQAYMAEKAIYFGDYPAFLKILETKEAAEAKKLGRQVKNFNIAQTQKKVNALRKDLRDKGFIEGSPVDGIWGVKVSWDDPKIDDEENWNGENRLGQVLNEVREALLKDEKE